MSPSEILAVARPRRQPMGRAFDFGVWIAIDDRLRFSFSYHPLLEGIWETRDYQLQSLNIFKIHGMLPRSLGSGTCWLWILFATCIWNIMELCSPRFSVRCCTWMSLDGPVRCGLGVQVMFSSVSSRFVWISGVLIGQTVRLKRCQVKADWRIRNGYLCWNLRELCFRPGVTLTTHSHPSLSVKQIKSSCNWTSIDHYPYPISLYYSWLIGFPNMDYKL